MLAKMVREQRCSLIEYHGSNRATFRCLEGHEFKTQLLKRDPLGREPSQAAIWRMLSWWSKSGVNMVCPKCKKQHS